MRGVGAGGAQRPDHGQHLLAWDSGGLYLLARFLDLQGCAQRGCMCSPGWHALHRWSLASGHQQQERKEAGRHAGWQLTSLRGLPPVEVGAGVEVAAAAPAVLLPSSCAATAAGVGCPGALARPAPGPALPAGVPAGDAAGPAGSMPAEPPLLATFCCCASSWLKKRGSWISCCGITRCCLCWVPAAPAARLEAAASAVAAASSWCGCKGTCRG